MMSLKQFKHLVRFLKSQPTSKFHSFSHFESSLKYGRFFEKSSITRLECLRSISHSYLSKSDSKSPENVSNKNVSDDQEFQNILNDFAKDFGLNEESQKILEDIKNSMNETDGCGTPRNLKKNTLDASKVKLGEKFKDFSEADSVVIPSQEELNLESEVLEKESFYHIDQPWDQSLNVDLKRGLSGVFDIDQLVEVLRLENLSDIAVIAIDRKNVTADFMVLATAKSPRHSKATTEYLLKLYKMKKHDTDPFIIIEGRQSSNWKVLDMGNIFLHIMLEDVRTLYDIESLWCLDVEYDSGGAMKPDPFFDAIKEQMAFFETLQNQPATEASVDPPK